VLLVAGALFLLSLRLRGRTSNVLFLLIVTGLILGLIYLSKVTMALVGVILFLIALTALLLVLLFRSGEKKTTVSDFILIGIFPEMFVLLQHSDPSPWFRHFTRAIKSGFL